MTAFDPRVTLFRDGVADAGLEGLIPASRYVFSPLLRTAAASTAIRKAPNDAAEQLDQLLYGEGFRVLQTHGDYSLGQATRDGYVGYVRGDALRPAEAEPTHRVAAFASFIFQAPSLKAPILTRLSLNALVSVEAEQDGFVQIHGGGWMIASHLSDFLVFAQDPVAVAEGFVGAPYQWGGRDSAGVDCSGLVQQALLACGRACPRDSDQQAESLGQPFEPGPEFAGLKRGDLAFWKGHVGWMRSPAELLHANGHHGATVIEPLAAAAARIAEAGAGSPHFRRL